MIKSIAIIVGAAVILVVSCLLIRKDKRKKQMEREIREERLKFVRKKFAEYLERKDKE
ncbi:hypothetical protein [Bacillus paranthracis]|uniref:hypothetical protein n=1 Tax=Bacillus paranthracis TaxID=2026186 RepID=UPI0028529F57|nr:hypothetical protein [Bacillus paranthracis]